MTPCGFGVYSVGGGLPRVGFRSGDLVLDCRAAGVGPAVAGTTLDRLLAGGRGVWEETSETALTALASGSAPTHALSQVGTHLPFTVSDYIDFYSSLEHARNLGRMFRPDADGLLPNWRWLPVGYHGRAGTVVVSGTDVVRPQGQRCDPGAPPSFGPSARLDFELELGFVIGKASTHGEPVATAQFEEHVFGVALVNDWSARDIQAWEYEPLGPFLGKSFQTSIAAWVTPLALLRDARVGAPPQEPEPLPYLSGGRDWGLDLDLEVELNGTAISRGNSRALYWTMPQQLAHATSNGAALRTGDLMASGTISGAERGSEGSLIELTTNGEEPLLLDDGTTREFLQDGDEIVLRGGGPGVELAEVRGRVVTAVKPHPSRR